MITNSREYFQVITSDGKHRFNEHSTVESASEHIKSLLNFGLPHSAYEYSIVHVTELSTEVTIGSNFKN